MFYVIYEDNNAQWQVLHRLCSLGINTNKCAQGMILGFAWVDNPHLSVLSLKLSSWNSITFEFQQMCKGSLTGLSEREKKNVKNSKPKLTSWWMGWEVNQSAVREHTITNQSTLYILLVYHAQVELIGPEKLWNNSWLMIQEEHISSSLTDHTPIICFLNTHTHTNEMLHTQTQQKYIHRFTEYSIFINKYTCTHTQWKRTAHTEHWCQQPCHHYQDL